MNDEQKQKRRVYKAQYRAEHKDEIRAREARYRSMHKDEISAKKKVYRAAHKDKIRVREAQYNAGRRREHRARKAAYNAQYYAEHKDELKAYQIRYADAHKDEIRARVAAYSQTDAGRVAKRARNMNRRAQQGSEVSGAVILEVQAEYGGICPYCNQPIAKGHIDHVVPISRGGTNRRSNLAYSCAPCNLSKSNNSLIEFMMLRKGS